MYHKMKVVALVVECCIEGIFRENEKREMNKSACDAREDGVEGHLKSTLFEFSLLLGRKRAQFQVAEVFHIWFKV